MPQFSMLEFLPTFPMEAAFGAVYCSFGAEKMPHLSMFVGVFDQPFQ